MAQKSLIHFRFFLSLKREWKIVELRQGLVSQGFFDSKRLCLG
jgi:hypothetical protein